MPRAQRPEAQRPEAQRPETQRTREKRSGGGERRGARKTPAKPTRRAPGPDKNPPALSPRRGGQLERTIALIEELVRLGNGSTLAELAERHGVDTRTISRDLAALQAAGFAVAEDDALDNRRKRWHIEMRDRDHVLTRILGVSHYLGLHVAMTTASFPSPSWASFAALEDLSTRIEKALGPAQQARLMRIVRAVAPYERGAYQEAPAEILGPLVEAIADGQLCSVTYQAPAPGARAKTLRIQPLRIFPFHGALYLHVFLPSRSRVITLHLGRILKLLLEDERLPPPPGYDPEAYERAAFGVFTGGATTTYRLRFTAAVAQRIRERLWHPTQVLEAEPDGAVVLTFTCDESPEVEAWAASWRENVLVLEPATLREGLAKYGAWLAARYRAT